MDISPVFFYGFAAVAIACSLLVVLKKNPVSSAFSLVLVFFCFAGIYALMEAHLVAAMQILVYAGAIMVLFVFVIMLLAADAPSIDMIRPHTGMRVVSVLASALLFGFLVYAFHESNYPAPVANMTPEHVTELGGNTRALSEAMFSDFVLPFDLTSVLLLGAIVGAVAIAKRKQSYVMSPDKSVYGAHKRPEGSA